MVSNPLADSILGLLSHPMTTPSFPSSASCPATAASSSSSSSSSASASASSVPSVPSGVIAPLDYTPPQGDPAAETSTLERCMALLRHDWVWDFFFDPSVDVGGQLRHAVSLASDEVVDFSLFSHDGPDPVANAFKPFETSSLLMLPSFSTGRVSVGFVIFQCLESSCPFTTDAPVVGRTVRSDVDGSFLCITEDRISGIIELSFFNVFSQAWRERVFLQMHYDRFMAFAKSFRAGPYQHFQLHSSLILFAHFRESRTCPQCGNRATNAPCACPISLRRKSHPVDLQTESANLSVYLGSYAGVGVMALYESPQKPSFVSKYVSTSTITVVRNVPLRDRLCQWALFHVANNGSLSMNPSPLMAMKNMPAGKNLHFSALQGFLLNATLLRAKELANGKPIIDLSRFASSSLSRSETPPTLPPSPSLSPQHSVSPTMEDDAACIIPGLKRLSTSEATKAALRFLNADVRLADPDITFDTSDCEHEHEHEHEHKHEHEHEHEGLGECPDTGAGTGTGTEMVLRAGESGDSWWTSLLNLGTEAGSSPIPSSAMSCGDNLMDTGGERSVGQETSWGLEEMGTEAMGSRGTGMGTGGGTRRTGAVVIAPAVGTERAGAGACERAGAGVCERESVGVVGGMVDERRRKAELRKVRNREAAHRSNQKRKVEMARLQDEIDKAVLLEARLRAKEQRLREENEQLRIRRDALPLLQ